MSSSLFSRYERSWGPIHCTGYRTTSQGTSKEAWKLLTYILALEEDHSDLVSGCFRRFLFLPISFWVMWALNQHDTRRTRLLILVVKRRNLTRFFRNFNRKIPGAYIRLRPFIYLFMNSLQSFPEKSFPKIKEKLRLSASSAGTL